MFPSSLIEGEQGTIKCQALDIRENQDLSAEDASFYLGGCFFMKQRTMFMWIL